ncbi:transposable element Tcb2 transposase [Trichonephila clavipes]|nr:transposable element Tcb2 transposase [Trichonephila clavipes]
MCGIALGRRIAARLHHPENTQQLKQMLIEEWALLQQEMLHQLVLSMRRRCEATIAEHWSRDGTASRRLSGHVALLRGKTTVFGVRLSRISAVEIRELQLMQRTVTIRLLRGRASQALKSSSQCSSITAEPRETVESIEKATVCSSKLMKQFGPLCTTIRCCFTLEAFISLRKLLLP